MAPNTEDVLTRLRHHSKIEEDKEKTTNGDTKSEKDIDIFAKDNPPMKMVWKNVFIFAYLHIAAFYGLYACVTNQVKWQTYAFIFVLMLWSGMGITAGAHRLWAHRSYKAKLPLKIFLLIGNTIAIQNSVWEWARDHRVHHKFSETHADPHNINRGFFFAHMGWLISRKHDAVKIKGKTVDVADLEADPYIMFQKKHYVPLILMASFFIPAFICWYFWQETAIISWCVGAIMKYVINLHGTWLVNSAAHMYGRKPYDTNIQPAENKLVAMIAFGEGWHNYHHTFPWDYKTSELGFYKYNITTAFIDLMAKLGQAYDLKTVPEHIVKQRVARTGDGSHHHSHGNAGQESPISPGPFAWGDEDIPDEDAAVTETVYAELKKQT